jgi:hypothetical protein
VPEQRAVEEERRWQNGPDPADRWYPHHRRTPFPLQSPGTGTSTHRLWPQGSARRVSTTRERYLFRMHRISGRIFRPFLRSGRIPDLIAGYLAVYRIFQIEGYSANDIRMDIRLLY